MPTISVVMPVYNDERFVGPAIDSILAQDFRDFEFIVINDGSTDGTARVLEKYSDPRFLFVNQKNKGIVHALNLGISMAKGKYIARMDSDDISRNDRFQKQIDFLDNNKEYGMVGSACDILDENGIHIAHFSVPSTDKAIRKSMIWRNPFVHSSIMVRKNILNIVGGYDQTFNSIGQDYEMWWRVLKVTKVKNLEEELVTRTHRASSTFRIRKDIHYKAMLRISRIAFRQGIAPRILMAASLFRTALYYTAHRLLLIFKYHTSNNSK